MALVDDLNGADSRHSVHFEQSTAPGACPIERLDMSSSTSIRTATVATALAAFTALGGLAAVPTAQATPIAAHQQGPAGAAIKVIQKANWQKEFKDATKGLTIQLVVDKAIEILIPKGSPGPSIPTVYASSISSPEDLVLRSSNPAGLAPRVSYVKSDNARALFYSTLQGGASRQSENSYKIGIQSVQFTPGTSSRPPAIIISNSAVTNRIVVLAN